MLIKNSEKLKRAVNYFSKGEIILWSVSVIFIAVSFAIFDRTNYMTLTASVIGTTSLIFDAKGHPFGQFLMIIFSVIYALISLSFSYYGEMITYLGMTAPMAVFALVSWLRNPYSEGKVEVKVNKISKKETTLMLVLTAAVTAAFYFILGVFGTAYLLPSTLSVSTSFMAAYLTARRSAYFALAYASNDIILIVLWTLASLEDLSYLSVLVCFVVFFVNDMYSFISWLRMGRRQSTG
ncbi:MAG: nicotinamide mononucleotide transporter [Firmicutes bacterium]|nr:nicotinamide mononucleotide transporter [Bacillota bacterium]